MNIHGTQLFLFIFLLCATLSSLCLCLSTEEFSDDERVVLLFKQWKEEHEKVYGDEKEEKKRLENFRASLKFVQEKNQRKQSSSTPPGSRHVVGLTRFADMSNEEFRQVYLSKVKVPVKNTNVIELKQKARVSSSCEAPPTLDWREKGVVTPIKDQGQCGTCTLIFCQGFLFSLTILLAEKNLAYYVEYFYWNFMM